MAAEEAAAAVAAGAVDRFFFFDLFRVIRGRIILSTKYTKQEKLVVLDANNRTAEIGCRDRLSA